METNEIMTNAEDIMDVTEEGGEGCGVRLGATMWASSPTKCGGDGAAGHPCAVGNRRAPKLSAFRFPFLTYPVSLPPA